MLLKKRYLLLLLLALGNLIDAQTAVTAIDEMPFDRADILTSFTEDGLLSPDVHRPDCPEPENFQLFQTIKGIEVSWEGPVANYNGARYLLRYRILNNTNTSLNDWTEELLIEGNSYVIQNPEQGVSYEVMLKKYCGGSGEQFEAESKWVGPKQITISNAEGGQQGQGGGGNLSCQSLTGGNVYALTNTTLTVEWYGPPATIDGARYFIRYKVAFSNDPWTEIFAMNGTSVTFGPLESTTNYEIQIRLVYGGQLMNYDTACDWLPLGVTSPDDAGVNETLDPPADPNLEIELPEFECGEPFTTPSVANTNLLASADTNDIFFIGGFPILLKQLSGGNGNFSGQGLIPLPFGQKIVKVSFTNVSVNTAYQIFGGAVNAVSDTPGNYPDLVQDPVDFGGEICVEPPSVAGFDENGIYQPTGLPYNPFGFNVNGTYVLDPPYPGFEPGDPFDPNYDPNGFNSNGIHVLTNSIYNENGCNQAGFNAAGQPCNPSGTGPYYWLNEDENLGAPTEAGIAFANQVADTLEPLVIAALQTLFDNNQTKVAQYRNNSNGIRSEMETLLTNLGHQRVFIFGQNDKYITEGMHQEFATTPVPLPLNIERNPNEVSLENKHIELYHQDDTLHVYLNTATIITAEQIMEAVGISVDELIELIKRFTVEEVTLYSNPANLSTWVFDRMAAKIQGLYQVAYGDGIGLIDWPAAKLNNRNLKAPSFIFDKEAFSSPARYLAMGDNRGNGNTMLREALASSLSIEDKETIDFEFQQGWQQVNGIHRAFYLDHIAKQRALLTGEQGENLLPIRVSKLIGGREYTMYLDNITFTPTGATLDAYFILEIPTTGDKLVFKALNISFGPTGATGQTRLSLETDIGIRLNNAARLTLLGGNNTFVKWDCDGFAGLGLDAEIEFCRKYLTPLHPTTLEPLPKPQMVTSSFTIQVPSWEELIVSLDITPFAVTKMEDIKWQVSNAVFDFSDTQTPSSIAFPNNYNSPFVNNGNASGLWRGFYLQNLSATLPNKFSEDTSSITVGVQNVIIDAMGFTGRAYAAPLLSLDDGNLNGWAFSIDTFGVSVVANHLAGADFNGVINVPLFSSPDGDSTTVTPADCFPYKAMIQPGNQYYFSVTPSQSYSVSMWKATATIDSTSTIQLAYVNDEFKAVATLHGDIEIEGEFGTNINLDLPNVKFQNVVISNKAPYFSPGTWSFPGDVGIGFAGLNITLSNLALSETEIENEVALDLTAIFNLTDNETAITAGGGVRLIGEMVESNGRQKWKYKKIKVSDIVLAASFQGVTSVHGILSFYENNVQFGTGFRGLVYANFNAIGVEVDAMAMFGRKEDYKYFFIDVLANLTPGIDFGGLKLISFGGGVYYHMNRPASSIVSLPTTNNQGNTPIPPLGASLSGIVYTPDKTKGLGLKATVGLATTKESVFNCNVTLEFLFNSGSGLSDIWLYGNGRFMEDFVDNINPAFVPDQKPNNNAAVSVVVDMHYAFEGENAGFDGLMEVYANVAGGIIRGAGANDKVGFVELHFSQQDWYINIGTPTNRNGMRLGIDGIGEIVITSYMDIGTNIPTMPDLPDNVASITGAGNFMANESMRASGNGFAFGSSIDINAGELDYLIFYANFALGLGFDVMVQDYNNAYCLQTGETIGINGWYASGQLWAYVQGDVGIKVNMPWGGTEHYKILTIGAAAVLQAKLPNPFWAKGVVGGYYSILGGTIKGDCEFEFTIGESCIIVGGSNPVLDIELISNLSPADGNPDIPVFIEPTALFSMPIGETFEMVDLNGSTVAYTVEMEYARLLHNGTVLTAAYTWNNSNQFLTLTPYEMLPPEDSVDFEVKVNLYDGAGALVNDEIRVARFYTGEAIDIIPEANVKASYPLNGQFNFYRKELTSFQGYILLKQGQSSLFYNVPDGMKQEVQIMSDHATAVWTGPLQYDASQRKITFPIHWFKLDNEELYKIRIVNRPLPAGTGGVTEAGAGTPAGGTSDGGGSSGGSSGGTGGTGGGGTAASSNNATDGPPNGSNNGPSAPPTHVLYEIFFRVSAYDKFIDKLNAFEANHNSTFNSGSDDFYIENTALEKFDQFEITGSDKTAPLVSGMANLTGNTWLNNEVTPITYDFLNTTIDGVNPTYFTYISRDYEVAGEIPYKTVYLEQTSTGPPVMIKEINFQLHYVQPALLNAEQRINYRTFKTIHQDYRDVRKQALEYMTDFTNQVVTDFPDELAKQESFIRNELAGTGLEIILGNPYAQNPVAPTEYANPPNGTYKVSFKYILPGTNTVTSVHNIELIKD